MHIYIYIMYIYIYGEGWGFPGMELYVIEMEFENVHFTIVFTVFMALYQFIGAFKVSDVARTISEFVRAENYISIIF